MLLNVDFTRFIVQGPKQLCSVMLPIDEDDSLLVLRNPRLADGLVIADHGLVFEQEIARLESGAVSLKFLRR